MTQGAERTRWKIRSDRLVDETPQVRLSIASLELASGLTFEQYVMRLPRCAMTVVLDEPAERILLIWRHRFIIDRWMWELPGGYIDPGEDGIAAAAREVEEETGYRPRSIEPILTFQPMTGSADSAHELYLARGADRVGAPLADEAEEVRWIPLADLPGLIATGQILGAATIIGAQHALLTPLGASRTVPPMAEESATARTPSARPLECEKGTLRHESARYRGGRLAVCLRQAAGPSSSNSPLRTPSPRRCRSRQEPGRSARVGWEHCSAGRPTITSSDSSRQRPSLIPRVIGQKDRPAPAGDRLVRHRAAEPCHDPSILYPVGNLPYLNNGNQT